MKFQIKRIWLVLLFLLLLCLLSFIIWFNSPKKLLDIDKTEVVSIHIFDRTQGKGTEITSTDDITHIIDNLSSIEIKPRKPSLGYMGYRFRVEVFTKTSNSSSATETFIINSETDVRIDPFFYDVVSGEIDFQFLQQLLSQES